MEHRKARFNTKFVELMDHNGEIVEIIKEHLGKDIWCTRYDIVFPDGTKASVCPVELEQIDICCRG